MAGIDLVTALADSVTTAPAPSAETVEEHAQKQQLDVAAITAPEDSVDAVPSVGERPQKAAKKQRARQTPAPVVPARSTPDDGGDVVAKGVAVELPVQLDARLSAYRAKTRKSHPTILLEAVERTYDQLPGLIRVALGREDEDEPRVQLFDRGPRTPAPIRIDDSEEKVRHTIRITKSNRQLLDELTDRFEAPSRNFLIVTAYDAFLPKG